MFGDTSNEALLVFSPELILNKMSDKFLDFES